MAWRASPHDTPTSGVVCDVESITSLRHKLCTIYSDSEVLFCTLWLYGSWPREHRGVTGSGRETKGSPPPQPAVVKPWPCCRTIVHGGVKLQLTLHFRPSVHIPQFVISMYGGGQEIDSCTGKSSYEHSRYVGLPTEIYLYRCGGVCTEVDVRSDRFRQGFHRATSAATC